MDLPPPPADPLARKLQVVADRFIFKSDTDNYAVLACHDITADQPVRLTGPLGDIGVGESLEVTGRWTRHKAHGFNFMTEDVQVTRPKGLVAIAAFLEGAMHGVGPAMATKIVDHFGEETMDVLDNDPHRLLEVPGIGPAKVESALAHWEEQRATRRVFQFLQGFGLTKRQSDKIYQAYGDSTLALLRENPFRIVEIDGFGFSKADELALNMGLAINDPRRVDAGLVQVLKDAQQKGVVIAKDKHGKEKRLPGGNCYMPLGELISAVKIALKLPTEENDEGARAAQLVADRVRAAGIAGRVILEPGPPEHPEPHIYAPAMHRYETALADKIRALRAAPIAMKVPDEQITKLASESEFDPTPEQFAAIKWAFHSRVSILTGGPGAGKTATCKTLCDVLDASGLIVSLCAPTGKAAKRITEATGHEGKTIHRLLEWKPQGGFQRNSRFPLSCDVLVVDESSMLDIKLANQLFDAVDPKRTHVVLVGDTDQLPAVGAGKVLQDIITSSIVPVTRLTKIFRQAARSMIIQAAYAVNRGEMPNLDPEQAAVNSGLSDASEVLRDYFYIPREENEDILKQVIGLAAARLPRQYGFNPITDIQVIAPQRNSPVGVEALNQALQNILNREGRPIGVKSFRVGDKLLCRKNDYLNDIMNGEFARIVDYDDKEELVRLEVDERRVEMGAADVAANFVLAYAVTCHSMQGSSAKAVVIPLTFSFFTMLTRPLLYTAITRAEQVCVVVGQKRALHSAISNAKEADRYTKLAARLVDPGLSGQLI